MDTRLDRRGFQGKYVLWNVEGKKIALLCPETYMNESGRSVRACADYYGMGPAEILVVQDDIDLPLGRVKVVKTGGAGGHKGVLSTIRHLGNNDFARVKIGIGRPRYEEPIEQYVLSPFYADERGIIGEVIQLGVQACELFVTRGVDSAMNRVNCQNLNM